MCRPRAAGRPNRWTASGALDCCKLALDRRAQRALDSCAHAPAASRWPLGRRRAASCHLAADRRKPETSGLDRRFQAGRQPFAPATTVARQTRAANCYAPEPAPDTPETARRSPDRAPRKPTGGPFNRLARDLILTGDQVSLFV